LSSNRSASRGNQYEINKLFKKYNSEIQEIESLYWRRRRLKTGIRSMIYKIGGKEIFNFIFN